MKYLCLCYVTLFRQPGVSDKRLAEDWCAVESDLHTLKRLLET